MGRTETTEGKSGPWKPYFYLLPAAWTLLILGLLYGSILQTREETRSLCDYTAGAYSNKDHVFLLWAASHGGVYVPTDERTPPNPHLEHVSERDVETPSGRKLTLMTPALMLRQVQEGFSELYGVKVHITSLKYFRSETKPDDWEKSALKSFERGVNEAKEFTRIAGKPHLRIMRPLTTSKQCLNCHARQGCKEGDLQGGISVAMPLKPFQDFEMEEIKTHVLAYGSVLFVGLVGIVTGMRRLKRIGTALQDERNMFVQGNAVVFKWQHKEGWPVDYVSSNAKAVFGYTAQEFLIGKVSYAHIIHKEDIGRVADEVKSYSERGSTGFEHEDYRAMRKDGTSMWLHDYTTILRDHKGEITHYLGYVIDVSDRKRAELALQRAHDELEKRVGERTAELKRTNDRLKSEIAEHRKTGEALRESEQHFRNMFEKHDAIMLLIQPETGRIMDANRSAARFYGYSRSELSSMKIQDINTLSPDEIAEAMWRAAFEKVNYFVFPHRLATGEIRTVEVYSSPVALPGKTALFSVIHDITERKKVEEALQESEQRFRAVFDNAGVGIDVLDTFGRFVKLNSALANMLGYSQEELAGISPIDLTHLDDLDESRDNHDALVEGKAGSHRIERRYIKKDGTIMWGDCAASAIHNSYGEYEATIEVISDITQRKRSEDVVRLRLELLEFAATSSLEELLQKTLDEVGLLTDSSIGFYHVVEEDQQTLSLQAWSTRTLKEFCTAEGKGLHYPITQAGVWADSVRERRPVIHNDYASLPHRKEMPIGHAPVIRELVVPIMRSGRIVAILGIGNKLSDYTQEDVETVAYLADVAWEIFERKRAEEQVIASLREKEILLREIHHRVKNNLARVCSLLRLQAGYVDETHRGLFADLEARVMSMALAHERLYKSESLAHLNVDEYIGGLVDHLVGSTSLGASIQLRKQIHNVSFGLDTAIPIGFILTELVSNCLKHAFPGGRPGEISISLRSIGEKEFELVVSDNGVGIPAGIDLMNVASLGMDLVDAFVTKLKGSMEILRDNGTRVRLKFKEI